MHGGAKWTMIIGAGLTVLGILAMVIGGASVPEDVDVDPTQDVVFSGSGGEITVSPLDYLNVYVQADSCDGISLSVLDDGEAYAYFYDYCDPNSADYGMSYYYPEGWIHVADIAPLDDERFEDGELTLDVSANVDVSIVKDPFGVGEIAAVGLGFVGCCLGIIVLAVGLVLWAVLDDPAPTMTYAQQGYVQPGMQTVGAVPGTYGTPRMVQAPVQAVPNAAGILPAQPVQPGMGAVVPGAVVGAYAVPVVPQGTTVVQAPVQQPQPAAMNMSAQPAPAPVQPTPKPVASPAPEPAGTSPAAPPTAQSQPAPQALEGQGTFWQKPATEEGTGGVGDEFMS